MFLEKKDRWRSVSALEAGFAAKDVSLGTEAPPTAPPTAWSSELRAEPRLASTDLELFGLPSSERFLVELLLLDNQDLTPSTRSSTSESKSESP